MMLMRPHLLDDSENTLHLAISADAKPTQVRISPDPPNACAAEADRMR
jgi:hypothetical protein